MKQETLKQLEQSLAAFGLAARSVSLTFAEFRESIKMVAKLINSPRRELEHRRNCKVIAVAISVQSDPVTKQVLWNLFKNLNK